MKVGTDGTLLGAWSSCKRAKYILDIGTGTGLIALMLAQRNSHATIDAIELDKPSAEEAKFNFKQSKWNNRLSILNTSLQEFNSENKYDLIVSNPPFFSDSQKSESNSKSNARHNDALPFEVLIKKSCQLLSENGILSIVLPVNEAHRFIELAKENNLHLIRKTEVYSNTNSSTPFRFLMEFSKEKTSLKQDSIIIETDIRHQFTKEYKELCKDFFLKF